MLNNYANFNGRAQRSQYWWFVLFALMVWLILLLVDRAIFVHAVPVFQNIWLLILVFPSTALAVRRLHDIGKSGWWYLISVIALIGVLVLIYWLIQPGTEGRNEYGPDPLA